MKLPFKTPIIAYIIFVLFVCIFYLYFTMYFEGAQAAPWEVKTQSEKQYDIPPAEAGTLPGLVATKNLSSSCTGIDATNKLNKATTDFTKIGDKVTCGKRQPILLKGATATSNLSCSMSRGSTNKKFNGICSKDGKNNYYLVSST